MLSVYEGFGKKRASLKLDAVHTHPDSGLQKSAIHTKEEVSLGKKSYTYSSSQALFVLDCSGITCCNHNQLSVTTYIYG